MENLNRGQQCPQQHASHPREPVFYAFVGASLAPTLIDLARPTPSGHLVSIHGRETLEQMQQRYPTAQVGEYADIVRQREEALTTSPAPISEDEFLQALGALPPDDWTRRGGWESFKMSERYSGAITSIYVRAPYGCFSFRAPCTLGHDQIVQRVRQAGGIA